MYRTFGNSAPLADIDDIEIEDMTVIQVYIDGGIASGGPERYVMNEVNANFEVAVCMSLAQADSVARGAITKMMEAE